jgi:hypothetical protein
MSLAYFARKPNARLGTADAERTSSDLRVVGRNANPRSMPKNNLRGSLFLGPTQDRYEEEADRAADQVVQTLAMRSSRPVSIGLIDRAGSPTDSEPEKSARLKGATQDGLVSLPPEMETRINSLRLGGESLKSSIRAPLEPRFGHDFSQVRIHCGQEAAVLAAKLNTRAFTVGHDIFVGEADFGLSQRHGVRLLAHELAHVVQQSRLPQGETKSQTKQIIRRYGHAKSCKDDEHLKPFVWPGHDHATKITNRALEELQKDPLHPTVKNQLGQFFGLDSATPANVKTIREKFERIRGALGEQYLYHCADPCESPNKGARAWTDTSGNKDITICFDQVKGFSAQAAGWVIAHENVHRGLNVWPNPHPWQPKDFDGCLGGLGAASVAQSSLVLDNPDSYACFASRMWFPL